MTSKSTKICPYCQTQVEEYNESTSRTQHSHRSNVRNGHKCPSCGYESWTETKVMDRGGRVKQIDSTSTFEKVPCGGVAVIRSHDQFIQNTHIVENRDDLKDVINRANKYREAEEFDAFYFVVVTSGSKKFKRDDNHYDEEQDLEDIADYKISDSGLEKLTDDSNDD